MHAFSHLFLEALKRWRVIRSLFTEDVHQMTGNNSQILKQAVMVRSEYSKQAIPSFLSQVVNVVRYFLYTLPRAKLYICCSIAANDDKLPQPSQ